MVDTTAHCMPTGHWAGQLVSLLWMFSRIFLMAFFAAGMASLFTAVQLQQPVDGPEDLA
jgi:hypothetical protein